MTEDIDAVYTWVDGTEPAFQASLCRYAPFGNGKLDAGRYRNNDELRFSLRSLLRYAPWVRRIHLLTNGQAPSWLDRSHSRIRLVRHEEVFPDPRCLPTFNSNAIEMCLHRIPDLSRRFLYFNDDVFLGRSVRPGDFFPECGGQALFVQNTPLPGDTGKESARDRACAHTQRILTGLWGPPVAPRLLPAHTPQAFDRDILYWLEALLQGEFRSTASHRFRSGDDLVLAVLYMYTLHEAGERDARQQLQRLDSPSNQYSFLMLENKPLWLTRVYLDILRKRPRFFCINDDLGDVPPHHAVLVGLRAFLRLYFPRRAPVERPPRRRTHDATVPPPLPGKDRECELG
jgi:hypothetical protein